MSPDAMGNSWSLFGFFQQAHALIKSLSLYLSLFFIIKQFLIAICIFIMTLEMNTHMKKNYVCLFAQGIRQEVVHGTLGSKFCLRIVS